MNKKIFCLIFLLTGLFTSYVFAQEWSYSGKTSPENWANLSSDFAKAVGKEQSPINIELDEVESVPTDNLSFSYVPSLFSITIKENSDHKAIYLIPANVNTNFITFNGEKYFLQQIHFHLPSEHTINEKHLELEAHLVHKNAKGELTVVGILYKKGKEDKVLARIWNILSPREGFVGTIKMEKDFPLNEMLPKSLTTLQYRGSLTTPPTIEGVNWVLFEEIKTISPSQEANFDKWIGSSNRPVQPLNGRIVEKHKG